MLVYLIVFSSICLLSPVVNDDNKYNKNKNIFLMWSAIILIVFSSIRGDFTADYSNYEIVYNRYMDFSMYEIIRFQHGYEVLYIILNKVVYYTFNSYSFLVFLISCFVVFLNIRFIKKYSKNVFLSVLMFYTIGVYLLSFNLMRQSIAISVFLLSLDALIEKRFYKYIFYTLLASLFHLSAIFMIPMYTILNVKKRKHVLVVLLISLVAFIGLNNIVLLVQNYFYSYYSEDSYGMYGYSFKSVLLPVLLIILASFLRFLTSENSEQEHVYFNMLLMYLIFSLFGLKIMNVQRISFYFLSGSVILVPNLINKLPIKNERKTFTFILIIFLLAYLYFAFNNTGFENYRFNWQ